MHPLQQILDNKLVAIMRGLPAAHIPAIAAALYAGGIRALEVTLNSAGALQSIELLVHTFGNRLAVGAGTVISTNDARNAIAAGASFIISPCLDEGVISVTKKAGLVSIPGAYTPTEIVAAHRYGADIIKVFPCPDPGYIKAIAAPLPHIRLMPVGGVNVHNIHVYAASGAVAFGIGSALVNSQTKTSAEAMEELTIAAKKLLAAIAL